LDSATFAAAAFWVEEVRWIEVRSLQVDVFLFIGRKSIELETGPAAQMVYFANPTMLKKGSPHDSFAFSIRPFTVFMAFSTRPLDCGNLGLMLCA